jgi:RNA polymerase sigma-70 factor (ECF subfamily)
MSAGDARAFDEFFNTYAPRLVAFIARRSGLDDASVEDIVQNTFVKAMRNLTSYRSEASLFTWLTQIGRHALVDALRKDARRPAQVSLEELTERAILSFEPGLSRKQEPAEQTDADLRRAAILEALNGLPERYALALEAKYGDGLSVQEIATMLGVTTTAAQSLLARARDQFRERWLAGHPDLSDWTAQDA